MLTHFHFTANGKISKFGLMNFSRIISIACLALFSTGSLTAEAQELVSSVKFEEPSQSGNTASELMMYALSMIGIDYKYGGKMPESGLDCSGFVSHVFSHVAGLPLPHNSYAISLAGKVVSRSDLKPGDLVFFNTLRNAFSHVGIYLGDNRFIHATSNATGNIMISNMADQYWTKRFNGARRVLTSQPSSGLISE